MERTAELIRIKSGQSQSNPLGDKRAYFKHSATNPIRGDGKPFNRQVFWLGAVDWRGLPDSMPWISAVMRKTGLCTGPAYISDTRPSCPFTAARPRRNFTAFPFHPSTQRTPVGVKHTQIIKNCKKKNSRLFRRGNSRLYPSARWREGMCQVATCVIPFGVAVHNAKSRIHGSPPPEKPPSTRIASSRWAN